MSYEMIGKLHRKFDTESKTASFQAREFVLESIDSNYTQYIKFQLTQDRCGLIDNYDEGQRVKVHFDLRGREWNDKYFTNLNAWKIEKDQETNEEPSSGFSEDPFPQEDFNAPDETNQPRLEDFNDLPF